MSKPQNLTPAAEAASRCWGRLAHAMDKADLATLSGRYPRTDEELNRAFDYVCLQHFVVSTR